MEEQNIILIMPQDLFLYLTLSVSNYGTPVLNTWLKIQNFLNPEL